MKLDMQGFGASLCLWRSADTPAIEKFKKVSLEKLVLLKHREIDHFNALSGQNFTKLYEKDNLWGLGIPGSNFFGKTPLFFRYSGVNAGNAANAINLLAKRR